MFLFSRGIWESDIEVVFSYFEIRNGLAEKLLQSVFSLTEINATRLSNLYLKMPVYFCFSVYCCDNSVIVRWKIFIFCVYVWWLL